MIIVFQKVKSLGYILSNIKRAIPFPQFYAIDNFPNFFYLRINYFPCAKSNLKLSYYKNNKTYVK